MTNFQFTQTHIDRLSGAGVQWAHSFNDLRRDPRSLESINMNVLCFGLTPRGLLVGTATDLLEKVSPHDSYRDNWVILLRNGRVNCTVLETTFSKHPTQEENLIDLIVDLSAQLKAKEMPDVEKMSMVELEAELGRSVSDYSQKIIIAALREAVRQQRKVGI